MVAAPDARAPPPTIFVSIASYRDSQCQYTVRDLFLKASHPERVFVGICHQVAESDAECFVLDLDPWAHQIRTYFLPHKEAKGPCYARSLILQELLGNEEYYFQIDSHFRFVPGWDEVLLEQLAACASPRPILTTLASAYELPRDHTPGGPDTATLSRRDAMMVLCADKFGDECPGQDDAFLRIKNRVCRTDFGHVPPPSLFWTARFHFSVTDAIRECPYDPYLDYVFFGEEISMSARFFTHGWDLFNPTKTVAYHLQTRFHRPFYTEVQLSDLSIRRHRYAKGRLYSLLGDVRYAAMERASVPGPPYGLGSVRTLADYEQYCGVNFREHRISDHANRGGVAPELLAPTWAEEARNELLSAKCFTDPEVWAGKGNTEALARQFPETLVKKGPPPELLQARDVSRMRARELAQRVSPQDPESMLDLGRACAHLGGLNAQVEDHESAREEFANALQYMELARDTAPPDWQRSAMWRGSLVQVQAAAYGGLQRYVEGKRAITEALTAAGEALLTEQGAAPELLALEVACLAHRLYEQTDDKAGLRVQLRWFRALLQNLRGRPGGAPAAGSAPLVLSAAAQPPESREETTRAKLLEVVLLLAMVPSTDEGDAVARSIFVDFADEVRGSARLQRQLGMIQAGGTFLDVEL